MTDNNLTGEKAREFCNSVMTTSGTASPTYTELTYTVYACPSPPLEAAPPTVVLYAAGFPPVPPDPGVTQTGTNTWVWTTPPEEEEEQELRTKEEIEDLMIDTLNWLSGIGDYPAEDLNPILKDLMEDINWESEDERMKIGERVIVKTLAWVLMRVFRNDTNG